MRKWYAALRLTVVTQPRRPAVGSILLSSPTTCLTCGTGSMSFSWREQTAVLAAHPGPIACDTLKLMPYAAAVCKETLRYYPPVPITARESLYDTTIPTSSGASVAVPKVVVLLDGGVHVRGR